MDLPNTPTARRLGAIITRWTYEYVHGSSGYKYYGTCSTSGCGREISLYKYSQRQEGNLRCRTCSKYRGSIKGVPIYSARLWSLRDQIVEMRFDGEFWRPYTNCRHPSCKNLVMLRHEKYKGNGKPEAGLCGKHWSGLQELRPFESAYKSLVRQTPKRGIKVTLTYKQYAAFCSVQECHYCGKGLNRSPHHRYKEKQINAHHLDRKDPRKGYTKDNCVPCCPQCNFAKNTYFTYEEMRVIGALRQGNRQLAQRLCLGFSAEENARTVQDIFDYVWKRKRTVPSKWNAKRKRLAAQPK